MKHPSEKSKYYTGKSYTAMAKHMPPSDENLRNAILLLKTIGIANGFYDKYAGARK